MATYRVLDVVTGEIEDLEFNPHDLPEVTPVVSPEVFASIGVIISDGEASSVEMPANIQGVVYSGGWLMVIFSEDQPDTQYQLFVTVDTPSRIAQYKSDGYFELVFSDNAGNPVEPGRADIQILKVR